MGSLKRIDSTKSNKGTAKTGGSLVRISTGEKIQYTEDQERSLPTVTEEQNREAEDRYHLYVSSARNPASQKTNQATTNTAAQTTGNAAAKSSDDYEATIYRLQEQRRQAQVDQDIDTMNRLDRQMKEMRASAGKQTIADRASDIASTITSSLGKSTTNAAGFVANAFDDPNFYRSQITQAQQALETGKLSDGKPVTDGIRKTLEERIATYQQKLSAAESKNGTANKIYSLADQMDDDSAKFQESAKTGLGTVGSTLVDAAISMGQSTVDGLLGAATGTGMLPFVVRAFGGATQEARRNGATMDEQLLYGSAQAAKEYITEKMFGLTLPQKLVGKAGVGGFDGIVESSIRKAVSRIESEFGQQAVGGLVTWLMSGVTESLEEGAGALIENYLINPTLRGWNPDTRTTEEKLTDGFYDMLVGGISGWMGGATNIFTYNTGNATQNSEIQAKDAAGAQIASTEGSFTTAEQNSAERVLGANTEVDTLSDDLASGKRVFHESLTNEQYEALSNRDDVDVDASGNVFQVNPAQHIDRRSVDSVGSRTMNAFQFDHPQLHSYYQEAAQALINDADMSLQAPNSRRYERTMQGNKVIQSANTSAQLREAMDSTGLSRNEIIDAAQRIINDQGQENVKAAKQVELILDTMLTNGYTTMSGETVSPNEAYTKEKGRIVGSNQNVSEELPIYDMEAGIVQAAYEAGKANLPRQSASLDTDAQIAAYEQGRRDYILSNPTVANSKTGAYTVSNEAKEGVNNGERGVHLRESGQRSDRADSAKQVSKLEKGTGRDQSREAKRRPRDGEAAHLTYGKKVSSAELGIRGGKTNDGVFLIKSGSTQATREAQRIANERGLKLVLFAGHDIHTNTAPDGARGYTDGTTLYVRVDDPDLTADQLTKHEVGHDMIAKGEVDIDAVRERIASIYGKDSVRVAAELYATAYAGTGMTAEEVWEECICDALGGMNIFRDTPADEFVDYFHSVTKKETEAIRQAPRAPPSETIGKYSRYWTPKLSKGEWSLLNNRMEKEMADSDNTLDDATKWLYASEKGTTVFALYGIGDGTEATVLYASSRKKAQSDNEILQKYLEGYDNEFDKDGAGFNQWVKSVRSQQGNRRHDIRDAGRGTEVSKDGRVHGEPQKRDGKGSSGTSKENRGGVTSEKTENGKYSRRLDDTYISAVNDGNMKEAQKLVDEAAESAMPDSKIRDKDGKLKPVYHGTKDMFWTFDTSVQGGVNGTAEGFGIYTSDNPAVTSAYGDRQLKMYANITKPATSAKKTITTAKLSALIKDTCKRQAEQLVADGEYESVKEALMDTWVSNYVYTYDIGMERSYRETAQSILQMNDSDMTVIQEVMSGMAIRGYDDALSFYRNSLTPITGFDGFVTQWTNKETGEKSDIILALDSSQLKSADAVTKDDNGNVIPLSERFNMEKEDIRFSRRVDTSPIGQEIKRLMDEGKTFKEAVDTIYQSLIDDYGAIDTGEKPYRNIQVPNKSFDKRTVSNTVRTVLEAQATPDDFIPLLKEETVKGGFSFAPITNDDTVQAAQQYILDRGWQKALVDWTTDVRKGRSGDQVTAVGALLYNHAVNAEDFQSALDIFTDYQAAVRNSARGLQAARILKTLTPDNRLYMIRKDIKNMVEDLDLPDIEIPQGLVDAYKNAKTNQEIDGAVGDIQEYVASQIPPARLFSVDWFNALRYLNMLGNFKTQVRNITGNVGMRIVGEIENVVATGIEHLAGRSIDRTRSIFVSKELRNLAKADFENVRSQALGEDKYTIGNENKSAFISGVNDRKRVFRTAPMEAYRKATNWAMNNKYFGDEGFSKSAYARALGEYLTANKVTAEQFKDEAWQKKNSKFLDKARQSAIKRAQELTFRDSNAISDWVQKVGRRPDTPKAARKLSEGILPFRRTPANVLIRAEEYSPLGIINTIAKAVQAKKGNATGTDVINSLSKTLTGTGIFMAGMLFQTLGLVRGGEDDDDKKARYNDLTGHQTYALEIPGLPSITMDWLTPSSMPFFMGVQLKLLMEEDGFEAKDLERAMLSIADPMLQMSMMQGLNDTLMNLRYADDANIGQLALNACLSYVVQGLTNSLLGQTDRTMQDESTMTYVDRDSALPSWLQKTIGAASRKVPFWDYNQIPYIDAWGRTEDAGSAFDNYINPAWVSDVEESPMEQELIRLYEATGINVIPTRAEKSIETSAGTKYLTAEEYVEFAKKQGQTAYDLLTKVTSSSAYQSLVDEDKAELVKDVYSYASAVAKMSVSDYQPTGSISWVKKAIEAESDYHIKPETFITAYAAQSGIEGWMYKDKKKKNGDKVSIENSRGFQVMAAIYDIHGLNEKQRKALYKYFGVSEKIWHNNESAVDEQLAKMKKMAE